MERMTYLHPTGVVWLKGCDNSENCYDDCFYCMDRIMHKALERLAQYEDLGMTPEQIKALMKTED